MVEMLVVIAIIAILASLLLPALTGGKKRAARIVCENQLQQVGIAFQSFAHDNNSRFPMQVSVSDGGSLELLQTNNSTNGIFSIGYRYFQPLGSFLGTPKVLVCPADTRLPALSFNALENSNVSYFVGVNAKYDQPMSILAGDGNLAASATMVHADTGGRLTWNSKLHEYKGNVLFADGHVEEWNDSDSSRLSSHSDIVLPTLAGSSTGTGSSSQPGPTPQGGNPTGAAPSASASAVAARAASAANTPPNNFPANPTQPGKWTPSSRENVASTAAGQTDLADSNPVVANVADQTVTPDAKVSVPPDTYPVMSPGNRKAASILRSFLVGTYLVVLLLLLAYAAYRIRRWRQEVERRRQFKIKLEQMRERYQSQR